jgi:hypothetical protein
MLIPSGDGDGMFSKTGRYTTEKFFILRKKDEILFGKQVKHDGKAPDFKVSAKVRQYLDELEEKRRKDNVLKIDKDGAEHQSHPYLPSYVPEPFKVMIGREDLDSIGRPSSKYRIKNGKIVVVGPVDKTLGILPHQPTIKLIKPTRPSSAAPGTRETFLSRTLPEKQPIRQEDYEFDPEKPKFPIPGHVEFSKKTHRIPLNDKKDPVDVEGKQFIARDLPSASSRVR